MTKTVDGVYGSCADSSPVPDGRAGGDWEGHIMGATLMLPYVTAAGHYKYTACLLQYLSDMKTLPPSLHDIFVKGLFNVKRKNCKMNCVSPDHALDPHSTLNQNKREE